jgi:hypothetical protein
MSHFQKESLIGCPGFDVKSIESKFKKVPIKWGQTISIRKGLLISEDFFCLQILQLNCLQFFFLDSKS